MDWGGARVVPVSGSQGGTGSGSVWGDVLSGIGEAGQAAYDAYSQGKADDEKQQGIAAMLSKNYLAQPKDDSPLFEQQDELTDEDLDPYEQQRRAFARF
jgi:hypothetical protein